MNTLKLELGRKIDENFNNSFECLMHMMKGEGGNYTPSWHVLTHKIIM